jgi:3',5'-cyclic AMP phosphodiesterase CpdA
LLVGFLCWGQGVWAFSFAVFGDNQGWPGVLPKIIRSINQDPSIDFVVSVGDTVGHPQPQDFQKYLKLVGGLNAPFHQTPGNHDLAWGGWRYYVKHFGRYYYSFDYEDAHFIVLNNAFKESFDHQQLNWLKGDLKNNTGRSIFVFMHKPTFDPSQIYRDHVMSGRRVTEELMALFKKYQVKMVVTGHIHGYARAERDGVIYLVTAGAGAPLYLPADFGGFYHYVKITVDGNKISEQVIKIDS